jgi:hypothetical protein
LELVLELKPKPFRNWTRNQVPGFYLYVELKPRFLKNRCEEGSEGRGEVWKKE